MKPEEEEIYNLLTLCFNSQKTIIEKTVTILKKYDPETLITVNNILQEEDKELKEELEGIFRVEQELKEDTLTVETHNLLHYIISYLFSLEHLFIKLDSIKRTEKNIISKNTQHIIKEQNLELTTQELKELEDIVKEVYTKFRIEEEKRILNNTHPNI